MEAPGDPTAKSVQFLHVLQGADAGVVPAQPILIQSSAGTNYAGTVVNNSVVMFPVDLADPFTSLTYTLPASATVKTQQ